MSDKRLKALTLLLWLAGLAAAVALIAVEGAGDVLAATAAAGWGLLLVIGLEFLPMTADTLAWQRLISAPPGVGFRRLFLIRWIGQSVGNLLPFGSLGGEVLRAWLAHRLGRLPGTTAGATTVVDVTLGVVTQVLFTLVGLAILTTRQLDPRIAEAVLLGLLLLGGGLLGFLAAQQAGLFGASSRLLAALARPIRRSDLVADARRLDAEIRALYRRPGALARSTLWRMLGWLAGTLEVWVGLWVLGHPVGIAEAILIESLIQAVRSAAFFVPGAFGVQEGGLLLLGAAVGLGPDVALALALVKRLRELAFGLPGLLVWQTSELHRAWTRRQRAGPSD